MVYFDSALYQEMSSASEATLLHLWEVLPFPQVDSLFRRPLTQVKLSGLVVWGNWNVEKKRYLLAVSRLPHLTRGSDPWLSGVRKAVEAIKEMGGLLLLGTDMRGWEYALWYAHRIKLDCWAVVEPKGMKALSNWWREWVLSRGYTPEGITFWMPILREHTPFVSPRTCRDWLLVSMADVGVPVAIRRGGFWDGVLNGFPQVWKEFLFFLDRGKSKTDSFNGLHRSIRNEIIERDWSGWLFHWTRGRSGPWPDETWSDYFSDLSNDNPGNTRDGLATLSRILQQRKILGDRRLFRNSLSCVSFTSLPPHHSLLKMTYRSTLHRWNWEPFGISLPLNALKTLGAKPVIYGDETLYRSLSENDKPYFQSKSSGKFVWEDEEEWRVVGDVDLSPYLDSLISIVPFQADVQRLAEPFSLRAISLFNE